MLSMAFAQWMAKETKPNHIIQLSSGLVSGREFSSPVSSFFIFIFEIIATPTSVKGSLYKSVLGIMKRYRGESCFL